MTKAKCQKCGALAVWEAVPSDTFGEYCDACVPRGCSCNIANPSNPRARKQLRDERGRLLPCCEIEFSPEGFEAGDPAEVAAYRARSLASFYQKNPSLARADDSA